MSGHQRLVIADELNGYDGTVETDYKINVECVDLSEKEEKEQNLFMNNRSVQGEFDDDLLKQVLVDIDYRCAGFSDFDAQMLGVIDVVAPESLVDYEWKKDDAIGDDESLEKLDEATQGGGESNTDRSVNFYEDSKENQIIRHNDVQKIKERIQNTNDERKDNGALSYVVLSFKDSVSKEVFMERLGYDRTSNMIDGEDFKLRLEIEEE